MQIHKVESLIEGFQLAFPLMIPSTDREEVSLQHRMYMILVADRSGLNPSFEQLVGRINENSSVGGTRTVLLHFYEDDGTIGSFEAARGDLKKFYHEERHTTGRQRRFKGL